MEQLWEVAERDLHEDHSGDERVGYNRDEERMEADEEEEGVEEEEKVNDQGEEAEHWDDEAEGQHSQDEEKQPRPMKRHRRKRGRQDSGGDLSGPSAEQGGSEEVSEEEDDGKQEVIEILSDDEDARSSIGRHFRGHEPSDFPPPLPSAADDPATTASSVSTAMEPLLPSTTAVVARAGDRFCRTGASSSPTPPFGPTSSSSSSSSHNSSMKDASSDPTGTSRVEPSRHPGGKLSLLRSSRRPAWRSRVVPSGARLPLGAACGEGKKDCKLLAEKMSAAKQSWSESRGSGEAAAEADLSCGQASSGLVGLKVLGNNTPATGAATATATASEFPVNLECPMCFNPLAVVALFACGHGACWECAHDWCGRGTTPTMDCPACHVCMPRNDFRRCVVLDEVVEKAVMASGLDDAEWQGRLQRGQDLARCAEASRRRSGEVQRSTEETIAKQATELERLRQEAKSRSLSRGRRSYEGFPPSMADFGFHLLGSGRDRHDSGSPTASPGTASFDGGLFRPRHPRAEPIASVSRGEAAAAATAAAAASLRVLPSESGVVRPRLHTSSSASSSFGLAMDNPWFSLRPSLSSRQHAGVSTSALRLGRETYARSSASTRSPSSSTVPGVDPAAGAALKSERERRYPTGQHRAHPARPSGSADDDAVTPGARARSAALSSLYALTSLPASAGVSFGGEDIRSSTMAAATLPPGRRLPPQGPSARSSRKRNAQRSSSRGMSVAAAATPIERTASSSSSSYSTEGGAAAVATSAAVGGPTSSDRFSLGLPGNGGALSGSRFEGGDSDLEALDMISSHDNFGGRPSEWDDVLAAVPLPHHESDDSQREARG